MQRKTKPLRAGTQRHVEPVEQSYLRSVGVRISSNRGNLGLTQYALAKQIGMSRNTLMLIETGQMNTTLLMIRKIAQALGTTIGALVERTE